MRGGGLGARVGDWCRLLLPVIGAAICNHCRCNLCRLCPGQYTSSCTGVCLFVWPRSSAAGGAAAAWLATSPVEILSELKSDIATLRGACVEDLQVAVEKAARRVVPAPRREFVQLQHLVTTVLAAMLASKAAPLASSALLQQWKAPWRFVCEARRPA